MLDNIWDDDFVRRVLQQGQWRFAKRSIKLDYTPSVTPEFGYAYAFQKPDDFVRLVELCSDEYFRCPLLHYRDAGSYWVADITELYVGFVSDDANFGSDLTKWPANFQAFSEAYMAELACPRLENSQADLDVLKKTAKRALSDSLSTDAQAEPTRFPPQGSWSRARLGNRFRSYDRA